MNQNPFKRYSAQLLFITAALVIACSIVTVFFKTNILLKAGSRFLVILRPFLFGAVIAYLINPLATFLEQNFLKLRARRTRAAVHPGGSLRMVSILLSLFISFLVIGLLILAVLPEVIRSVTKLYLDVPAMLTQFTDYIVKLDKGPGSVTHELVKYLQQAAETTSETFEEFLRTSLIPTLRGLLPQITTSFLDLFSLIYNFGIGCIIASYLLGAKERFFRQAKMVVYGLFPEKAARWIEEEVHITDAMFSGFIHGKLIDSALIGFICYVFCRITNMPYALLISLIVGVTNIIPFFGPYIGMVPSALLILITSPARCVIFLIFINILQQIDGNIIGPALLGDRLGLSGIWILFSIMFFSNLMGFAGMIVGAPIFAIFYDLVRRFIFQRLRQKNRPDMVNQYQSEFHPPKIKKPRKNFFRKKAD